MSFIVAVYLREDQVWKRHKHSFSTFNRADDALQSFVRTARDSLEGKNKDGSWMENKVRIFSSYQWDMLAIGYKHPLDRPKSTMPKKATRPKIHQSQIAEQLREALRAL